ncbi:hypothetical protein TUM20985_46980 [Mycobacterium antarcticum]|nr:hypothetical protein TUM20985_46980 [Mycolicibacterium sp. TUM20985]GLP77336.1 hypothetical protein TUM20983_44460 [Mycolicibacterium sp. TUM20983]GLP82243.1 hypothetical protein TUM20984_36630 [Mycolicibacterium sp. TUM20984]
MRSAGYAAAVYLSVVHRPPRSGVSPLHALSCAENSVAIKVGTGCAREGAGRMPDQANLARGNPNSMPQNWAGSKSLGNAHTRRMGTVPRRNEMDIDAS